MPADQFQSLADFLGVTDPVTKQEPASDQGPSVDITAKDFSVAILNTKQYRDSLLRRILMDELPPAVEVLLYHYAHGKPTEKLEHSGPNGGPIETTRRIIDPAAEGG